MNRLARTTIDTGAVVSTLTLAYPRPGPVGRGRSIVTIRPGPIAVHPGDDPAELAAFAAHLCEVWAAFMARHGCRRG